MRTFDGSNSAAGWSGKIEAVDIAEVKRKAPSPRVKYATGYGAKIPTNRLVRLVNCQRWRRVYIMCYSNVGVTYIIIKGRMWLIDVD